MITTSERIKDLTKVQELNYDRSYTAANDKIMDEVMAWVGEQSLLKGWDDNFSYYSLDEEQTQVVRFNIQNRIINLSRNIPDKIHGLIKHILDTEIRNC